MNFYTSDANIENNQNLRAPQIEGYTALKQNFLETQKTADREHSIILPVGCGKSGLIAITPFAYKSKRTLVIAPNVKIAQQLHADVNASNPNNFYKLCSILLGEEFPEPAEIRGSTVNISDLEEADIVVTNIQQLQGEDNRWFEKMNSDFFDLILFDEGHHSVATSWEIIRSKFSSAQIVNYSATPQRADGQIMGGRVIYSFPVARAIQEGYVKKIKAIILNPSTLKFVREDNGQEQEVSLEEVKRLGEEDSDFRRSILTSRETLATIVDASINELQRLRVDTGEKRLKIIATALNYRHCIQVKEAYVARGMRADYVHAREDSKTNDRVFQKLENHELDVIVQVRKLGEGFNHKFLSVAAVCNVFSSLSPFVQFVGRIMRTIVENDPNNVLNRGTVVYHAGANIARLWNDFKNFSEADQEYFDQLLPEIDVNVGGQDMTERTPDEEEIVREIRSNPVQIQSQGNLQLEIDDLVASNPDLKKALELIAASGISGEAAKQFIDHHKVPITKVAQRKAARSSLDEKVKNAVGRILSQRKINHQGQELDRNRIGKTNFVVVKSAIDKKINELVGRKPGERHEFSRDDLERIEQGFDSIVSDVEEDIFSGT